jgi:hypothetical protein
MLQDALARWFTAALGYLRTTSPPLQARRSLDFDEFGNMHARVGGGEEPYIWLWTERHRAALSYLVKTSQVSQAVHELGTECVQPQPGANQTTSMPTTPEHLYDEFLAPLLQEHLYVDQLHFPTEISRQWWNI